MRLRAYVAPGPAAKQVARAITVEAGTINANRQQVTRKAGRSARGMAGQQVYVLHCLQPGCGHQYGEEGIRVHQRKCPRCQGGGPGLPVPDAMPGLFD